MHARMHARTYTHVNADFYQVHILPQNMTFIGSSCAEKEKIAVSSIIISEHPVISSSSSRQITIYASLLEFF